MAFNDISAKFHADARVRGQQFELLRRWYLQNAPEYRNKIERVWLWQDWPDRWGADAGIDLVAETLDGELWAIQAKAYDPAYSITKSDVDTFLSESSRPQFAYRLLIATTDGIGANAYRTLVDQEKPVGLALRSHLDAAEVEWPLDFDNLLPARAHPKTPRPHQQEAIDAVRLGFADAERGQLIMACGTGKTLVALWTAEALKSQRTLVLVPSLTLLSQTLREWTANSTDAFAYLAVCSDDTVAASSHDAMVSWTADLGLPVTTDASAIERFLRREGRGAVFATYQSSRRIAEAQANGAPEFDVVIADEAHRCTGPASGDFATVLEPNKIRARRRLFMTATPRYYTDRVKKVAGEADYEVASMDDEATFGRVFHQLTFGQAIERDLLSDYQVLVVGVDDETCAAYVERGEFVTLDGKHVTDARTLAAHIAVAKAMKKYDLKKTITFHGRVNKAQAFSSMFPSAVDAMPEDERPVGQAWSRYVSGEMPTSKRDVLLQQFRHLDKGSRGLLANARCLAEGVDVPAIDGIAFIDPRSSTVDIVQAVGRAIRRSEDKTHGTIVLPVFLRPGDDAESTLDDSSFKAVWQVLNALRAHDNVLAEELDALRRGIGRDRSIGFQRPAKIALDVPANVGSGFFSAFDVRLVERTTSTWDAMAGLLAEYKRRFGHVNVTSENGEPWSGLVRFIHEVRVARRGGKLSAARVHQMEALGLEWLAAYRVTLDDTTGLLKQDEFKRRFGFTSLATYLKKGLITPAGYAKGKGGLSRFFHPSQADELRAALGITLESTEGLLSENQFRRNSGLGSIAAYRKKGLVKPVGVGMSRTAVGPFYRPSQVEELKAALSITLDDTTGLISESQLRKQFTRIATYRARGLISPVGYGKRRGRASPFYRPSQVAELKAALGITLDDTAGLLNETEFMKRFGFSQIAQYRERGLIMPVGYAIASTHLSPYYRPSQAAELKAALGVTLDDTTGLLPENQFGDQFGFANIAAYRKRGLIKPVGCAITHAGLARYYRPSQAEELRAALASRSPRSIRKE